MRLDPVTRARMIVDSTTLALLRLFSCDPNTRVLARACLDETLAVAKTKYPDRDAAIIDSLTAIAKAMDDDMARDVANATSAAALKAMSPDDGPVQ